MLVGDGESLGRGSPMGSLSTGALFDEIPSLRGLDPADPYPAYAEIFGPPLLVSGGNAAVVTRYSTCAELLRHHDVSLRRDASPVFRGLNSSFLNVLDPPEHTRIRALVNQAFTPRSVMLLEPWLHDRVDQLLDAVSGDTFEVIASLAYPLPLNAICQLLDIPDDDRDLVMTWSRPITLGADLLAGRRSREDQKLYRSTLREFRLYIRQLIESRRASPGADLISQLLSVDEAGDRLTEREVIATAIGLLITGHETTVSLIGHGALALAANPELCESVGRDERQAEAFVEEVLRYDSPVQATLRVAKNDMTLDGVDIPAGCALLLLLGAADRDPDQFADPNRFDPSRSNNRTHLAFGGGPHFCVGASLGRMEATIALSAIGRRIVNPRARKGGTSYDKSMMLRTQTRLILDVDAVLPSSASLTA